MKKLFKKMDKPLLIVTILLCSISLVMVFSSSSVSTVLQYKVEPYYFFKKQLLVMVVSFIFGFIVLLKVPIKNYDKIKSLAMIFIIFILGGLFTWGTVTNNATSWYSFKFFSIQPSEFAKSIVILYMACYFGKNLNNKKRFFFLRPIIACAIVAGLIYVQPDLGTAAIVGLITFLMFMAIPFSKKDMDIKHFKTLGVGFIVLVASVMIFGGELLNSEQQSRLTYRNPCTRYSLKTGYQVCNGMIAINNGGLFGVGLGNSTQKYLYLPEAHTDFIYPIIVEELGSIVGSLIIVLYLILLLRILKIAKHASNLTGSLIAYGTFIMILLHLIINFGGILALIPLTGVPLPLLSYGGSITLNTIAMIFLTLRVSIESKSTVKS